MAPKLVYDDDCSFCTLSATYVDDRSDVVPVPLSEVGDARSRLTDEEHARLPENFADCAQLVTDDAVYSCGEAIERSLVRAGVVQADLVDFLNQFDDYVALREAVYRHVSDHRILLSNVIGPDPVVRDDSDSDSGSGERSSDEQP